MSETEGTLAPPPDQETAARYLARCLIADCGYVSGVPAEAAPLAAAADYVLTGGDGVGLTIACIIDRDADPTRRFTLEPARIDEIAAACRVHAGSLHGLREAVTVELWEIGAGVSDADVRARFEGYTFRRVTQKGVGIRGFAIDTAVVGPDKLYTTAADRAERATWVAQVLDRPRRSDAELAAAAQRRDKLTRFHTRPVATLGLLAAFAAMFVLSLLWTVMPNDDATSPNIGTLISLGALEHGLTEDGEWWRMLTCAFLHGGLLHLLFNGVAMYMAGGVLENLVGRRWMLALFVVGAIGGSIASLALNAANITSVGASGAIMALLAAAMVLSLRMPSGPARTQILVSLGQILVPSLLPLFKHGGGNVDYGAHLGGAITGAIAGALLLLSWSPTMARPRATWMATAVAALGLAVTGYGLIQVAVDHGDYTKQFANHALRARNPELVAQIVPQDKLPNTEEGWATAAPELLESYPRDPRVRYFAYLRAKEAGDADAKRHLEAIVADHQLLVMLYGESSEFEVFVRALLAEDRVDAGDTDTARALLAPLCAAGQRSTNPQVRDLYQRMCIAP